MWLNNCVGSLNYRSFMALITSFEIELTIFIIASIMLWVEDLWNEYLGYMIATWIVMVLISVLWFLNLFLLILHIFLIITNQTTYSYFFRTTNKRKIAPVDNERTE